MTTPFTLTFDCAAPGALAAFWCEALGYVPAAPPAGFDSWEQWLIRFEVPEDEWDDGAAIEDPSGAGPRISFLKVPEPKRAKNRIHVDVQVGGGRATPWEERWPKVRAKADRLIAAGATEQAVFDLEGRPDHVVLLDPEGNEFCVV
ncbi:VOC family protein [Dactylosporangium sp. CA-139114]|uniref:VOC family protein n=1 Tax=Dactylosporangium sp. CA-139114 TaxID=3239931 RepID=UPI003D968BD3